MSYNRSMGTQNWLRMAACSAALALGIGLAASAQNMESFEKRTTVKVLPNGLTLIVCERPEAPVFSYYTMVNAGSADDPQGQSGLAHMFEHMAFKGTDQIGTTDYPDEKLALAKVETAYAAYDAEYRKRVGQDPARLAALKKSFEDAEAAAQKYVVPNAFAQLAEQNGAEGLNASTAEDSTQYFWSMPSNRLELWAYMESGRIGHPVEREFYKERDVVQEERRMRIDSSPVGRLVEQMLATAYVAHPYGRSGVGWESEISQVTATEAETVSQEILRTCKHSHRGRRRRKSRLNHSAARTLLRFHPCRSPPGAHDDRRARAVRRAHRHHPRSHPALLHRRLPPA